MADFSKISAAVDRVESVDGSVVALVIQLAEQIRNLPADQAAIDAFADRLAASSQTVADAVVANTPAAPPVV